MPKPNTYLLLKQAEAEIRELQAKVDLMKAFTLQQSLDMAQITLHGSFGFGPTRQQRFKEKFTAIFLDYAKLCVEDGEQDPTIIYTQFKVDQQLKAACGEHFTPWENRYDLSNLYFRDKLKYKGGTDQ